MMFLAAAVQGVGHSTAKQECSCAQHEAEAPFTIDCNNAAQIRAATTTLETTCTSGKTGNYEWGGIFATPASTYKWVSQAAKVQSDGTYAYADPEMKLVIFSTAAADAAHLMANASAAKALMAGTCPVVNTQGSIPAPTAAGACYTLTFPTTPTVDFHATVNVAGVSNVAFFAAHGPTEFERDTHYFMSTDLATDIEPAAQTDAKEYNCKVDMDANGLRVCKQAFFIIEAHHDYCPHDTLTRYEEELFHQWESKCFGCSIKRKYDPTLKSCPVIDCTDTTVAELGYEHLHQTCVKADTTYPFEWEATFDTPADSYTWVSQAATAAFGYPGNYRYADETMKVVAIAMPTNTKSALFGKKDVADALMSTGSCPEVTVACTPGAVCASAPTLTPTTAGACVTVRFPNSTTTLEDFHATVNTAGVAHVAFFTAHVPKEFERDMHYFMSADLATDIEPVATLGAAAAHDHGRRLSEVVEDRSKLMRRNRRSLANSGSCCNTTQQQGAWKQVVAYHDLCAYNIVPNYIEVGFHDYEASCENYFCNLVGPEVDQTVCPYSPPPPPSAPPSPPSVPAPEKSTGIDSAVLIGAVVPVSVVLVLFLGFIIFMAQKEKAGTPIFTTMKDGKGVAI